MSSVALVVLDTLRYDSFEEYFGWLPGIRFENAYSTSGWTVPAHGSLFTGKYPSESGVYAKFETLSPADSVLAESLARAGYTTRGFSANANISDAFDFTSGFNEFHHSWRGERREEGVVDWGEFVSRTSNRGFTKYLTAIRESLEAERTLKSVELGVKMKARDLGIERIAGRDDGASKAEELIDSTDFGDREFLFLNLMEAHSPYKAPKPYRSVELESNPNFEDTIFDGPSQDATTIRQAYDDCVRYLSDVYEDIFAKLSREFDFIITVSDHGEMFGKAGIWDHNFGIYPELTHIPLSIYDGQDGIERRMDTVSLRDIYATILSIADGVDPEAGSDTRNLLNDAVSRRQFIERFGLRTSRIEKLRNKGYEEEFIHEHDRPCFGVVTDTGGYAWESRKGVLHKRADDGARVETVIKAYRDSVDPLEPADGRQAALPGDIEEQLEKLGYL